MNLSAEGMTLCDMQKSEILLKIKTNEKRNENCGNILRLKSIDIESEVYVYVPNHRIRLSSQSTLLCT